MAKAKAKAKKENALIRYLRETRVELTKVNWPSRQETVRLTQIVLVVTVSLAMFLGLMDWFFDQWLEGILISNPWWIGLAIAILTISVILAAVLGRQRE